MCLLCVLVFYVCRLREREERGKRRVEDLHTIAKLQDKLSERDQLIKSLVVRHAHTRKSTRHRMLVPFCLITSFLFIFQEDLHQISQHPTLCSNELLKTCDSRTQAGTLTPTMKVPNIQTFSNPIPFIYSHGQ